MAGRRTKLTPELQAEIVKYLTLGSPVTDVCAQVGISETSYFRWAQAGGQSETSKFREFWEATSRAQVAARVSAVSAIRSAMMGTQRTVNNTTTISETRLRKMPNGEEVPYEYTRTTRQNEAEAIPADWRAAVEYLKRRDPKHWSEKLQLEFNISPELLKRLADVSSQANIPPSELFESMLNAIANQLELSGTNGAGERADAGE